MAGGASLMTSKTLVLATAGLAAAFDFPDAGFCGLAARRYKNFSGSGRPLYRFAVSSIRGAQAPFRPAVSEERGVLSLKRGDFDCVLDLQSGRGTLKCAPREQALDSFLRCFYSWLLPRKGGLLLHAASFARNGKAYLFPGRSGAGKSTLSKLAARAHFLLSDELVPVRKAGGRFRAWGSPFWGEMRRPGENRRFDLGGVYKLAKAGGNQVRELPGGRALGLLLRCSMNFAKDAETAALMLSLAAELAATRNSGELRFAKKNDSFTELVGV
ncbi:MAG TPA: hypothetical protein DCZ92_02775 [Elusimicrobia bacterium]|nr:MAG: hypothetical protein A2016_09205 [Elusimicrobia bacterium GWF2_62_30]HBA59748.1 hypothetical protein [Elusimicrobiota bacterium]